EVGFIPERPTILLNTGAATAETKRWPIEHAVRAASELSRQHGYQIMVHCGPAEREIANRIEEQTALPGVRSMGRWTSLPLGLSKAVIERSVLVVSTDSGPRHIAVAMNKPVISMFGSVAPDMTRSYNEPETIVTLGLACQPCGKYECPLKHTQCMNDLDAERVVRAALLSLEQQKRRAT
ncbi:MAG: glycosyltransferase family 9 protein, partial [Planctomycetes bacterium]|nr:glycosyltransferase family 9 protein [Planctomycetota bacterium]